MQLHFLPFEPVGELIALDEAITLAITGHAALDLVAYQGTDGQLIKLLRVGRGHKNLEYVRRYERAAAEIGSALRAAELKVIVQSSDSGKFFKVPRGYWFGRSLFSTELALELQGFGYRPDLDGQPLMVDAAQHQDWLNVAQRPNEAVYESKDLATPQDDRDDRDNRPSSSAHLPPAVTINEWAADAAGRGVTIKNARADARECMGAAAPAQEDCRIALRAAKEAIGKPVSPGRPLGRKSWVR